MDSPDPVKLVTSSEEEEDRRIEEEERKGDGGRRKANVVRISCENTRSRRIYVTEFSIVLFGGIFIFLIFL